MPESITIGRLAKAAGLSRSTLLYYDRLGLLQPVNRSAGNYRLYEQNDVERLRRICLYRNMGIPLGQIARLLDRAEQSGSEGAAILQHHLEFLETQIETLQRQQRQVVKLLEQLTSRSSTRGRGKARRRRPRVRSAGRKRKPSTRENEMINKDRWVEIMRAAGLGDEDMHNWHRQFERLEPSAHQEFLESLGIDADEITHIRERSRQ